MREDFEKLLCEEPRYGSSWKNDSVKKSRRYKDIKDPDRLDELPRHERMKPRDGWLKDFGEHLGPLKRFLRSRVGKPWDDVYSEIRERVRVDKATQLHILQHLEHYVFLRVRLDKKSRVYDEDATWGRDRQLMDDGQTFYVDPRSGILKVPARKGRRYGRYYREVGEFGSTNVQYMPPEGLDSKDMIFEKINGTWFEVTYQPTWGGISPYRYRTGWEIVKKRTLSKKELKFIPDNVRYANASQD